MSTSSPPNINPANSDPSSIRIPASFLPSDGRFGSGPSKVRASAIAALGSAGTTYLGTSHRQKPVTSMVGRLRAGLRELFNLPDGYEVVLGNGGTTCFWDMASFCLVDRHSQHLSFGEFSAKFASVVGACPHLDAPEVITCSAGTHPAVRPDAEVDLYALTHNETTTGVSMDVRRPVLVEGAASHAIVVVDATSAAGGLRVDVSECDTYYFAPQKCFASDGGLWVALLSPAALARVRSIAESGRWVPAFLDLGIAIEGSAKDQTYNTPALATLFLMVDQIEWMLEKGGLEWAAGRCDDSAESLYGWAEASEFATPFVADPAERSHVTGCIDFNSSVDAALVAKVLRAHGMVDTEPYRKLGRNQLRIAMFPSIDPADIAALTACIDHVVAQVT